MNTALHTLARTVFIITLLCSSTLVEGKDTPDSQHLKFFEMQVRPLLARHCLECHSAESQKGMLRLDSRAAILKGGESEEPAVIPGNPEESLLISAVRHESYEMPPQSKLTEKEIEVLVLWIEIGAPWPDGGNKLIARRNSDRISEEDRKWWAVQPVTKPEIPQQSGKGWARNEIDHFIARKLKKNNLSPAADAGPLELVRRMYFDLHGLPPLPVQTDAFVKAYANNPDEAIARLIDQLLASPRYGERWGQYWLDVVRYAESDGYNQDAFRPGAKDYRNYVIDSYNQDKPWPQFVREQLAGDLIADGDPNVLIGTSYLRQGVYEYNQHNVRMHWDIILTDVTNVTGEAFLGVSIGCAQCHDHKFDPILQEDYFALQSFFSTISWPSDVPLATTEQVADFERQQEIWETATAAIRAEIEELQAKELESLRTREVAKYPEDIQKMVYKAPEDREPFEEQMAMLVDRFYDYNKRRVDFKKKFEKKPQLLEKWNTLNRKLAEFDHLKPAPLPKGFVATDVSSTPVNPTINKHGKDIPVEPAFLTLLGEPKPTIHPTENNTGRRLALANWIAAKENALSNRVITNRIWQGHFGTGLVATPNDFGNLGESPSHPELLDWLTSRFLERGSQFKQLHRLIMTSATYRMTARKEPGMNESRVDPANRLLWRYPPRRLTSEEVRDSMLAASGEIRFPKNNQPNSVAGTSPDRSIYVKKLRNKPDPLLNSFDSPMGFQSIPRRSVTTTPIQSLLLINNSWPLKRAKAFARSLPLDDRRQSVITAYRRALGRRPSEIETEKAISFIDRLVAIRENANQNKTDDTPEYLRSNSENFASVNDVELGTHAVQFKRKSAYQQIESPISLNSEDNDFTIESVVYLDSIYPDGTVNTLANRWDNNRSSSGWFFCVTSTKSRYQPRNLLFVMNGVDHTGAPKYEVAVSNLRVPVNKPVYLAASVRARPVTDGGQSGDVTFYMKDLSNPQAKMQTVTIDHAVVGSVNDSTFPLIIGGRGKMGHLWDGQMSRFTISQGQLSEDQLLDSQAKSTATRVVDWDFTHNLPTGSHWYGGDDSTPVIDSLTDFCHLLFNSNEFLYLY